MQAGCQSNYTFYYIFLYVLINKCVIYIIKESYFVLIKRKDHCKCIKIDKNQIYM